MGDVNIIQLTKPVAVAQVDDVLNLEHYMDNIGGPDWTAEHILKELPRKWELSFLIQNAESLAGYVVASERQGRYHIHRPFLHPDYRRRKTRLLIREIEAQARRSGFAQVSWKMSPAIHGFTGARKFATGIEYAGMIEGNEFYWMYSDL